MWHVGFINSPFTIRHLSLNSDIRTVHWPPVTLQLCHPAALIYTTSTGLSTCTTIWCARSSSKNLCQPLAW